MNYKIVHKIHPRYFYLKRSGKTFWQILKLRLFGEKKPTKKELEAYKAAVNAIKYLDAQDVVGEMETKE